MHSSPKRVYVGSNPAGPTKRCGRCRTRKVVSSFGKNRRRPDGLSNRCRQCKRNDYLLDRDHHIARVVVVNRAKRKVLEAVVDEYLLRHPCVDCDEKDIVVLEFDHVRGEKRNDVSRLVANCCSVATLMVEIDKCDVRCANCHRRITKTRRDARKSTGL